MGKKSLTKNYIFNLLYQVLAIVLPLITTPYLSRVLGAENIGVYSYTLSITTYFILFGSLGVALYGQREIAFVQDNVEERSKLFWEILIMKIFTLTISLVLFYICFCIKGEYHFYYQILTLEIFANMVDISWFFQGLEEFKKTVARNTIIKLISIICIFAFVKTNKDLEYYFIIYVLSNFIGNGSLWFYLPKLITKIQPKELNIKRHIKPTILLFIPQIATQVYTVLDKTMIGIIIQDKSEVGFYEQAQKIVKLLLTIVTSLGTVMMPRIAATYAKGELKKVREYMNKSFSFIMMLSFPIMMGLISISCHFVPLFYGSGYEKVSILLCILSPIIVFIGLSNVTGTQFLLPTKKQNQYTLSVIMGAIINFIFNILLIIIYASIGAAIATIMAEFAVTTIQFIAIRKEIDIKNVFKNMYKFFISSIIMLIFSINIGNLINNDFVSIVVQIISSSIIYFTLLLLLKEKMIIEAIDILKTKIIKE